MLMGWIKPLDCRNKLSHVYGGVYFDAGENLIRNEFYYLFHSFHKSFLQPELL